MEYEDLDHVVQRALQDFAASEKDSEAYDRVISALVDSPNSYIILEVAEGLLAKRTPLGLRILAEAWSRAVFAKDQNATDYMMAAVGNVMLQERSDAEELLAALRLLSRSNAKNKGVSQLLRAVQFELNWTPDEDG